jgi:hypothetical protein
MSDRAVLCSSAVFTPWRSRVAFALFVVVTVAGCAGTPARPALARTTAEFCITAQTAIVAAQPVARNEIHDDFTAFTKSKPVAKPLLTTQYVWRENSDPQAGPMMISCKMKTADHLIDVYGAGAAGADIGCSGVNEITLRQVLASFTAQERRQLRFDGGRGIRFETDIVTTQGPVWLEPYALATLGADGSLQLQAKGMRNDWLDPRYAEAPPQFRGTRYCHLIAPEYLRRLLLGEVEPNKG